MPSSGMQVHVQECVVLSLWLQLRAAKTRVGFVPLPTLLYEVGHLPLTRLERLNTNWVCPRDSPLWPPCLSETSRPGQTFVRCQTGSGNSREPGLELRVKTVTPSLMSGILGL